MSESLTVQPSQEAVFSLEDVHFAYERDGEEHTVLRGVNLALFPGQKIGLYGPNGSGKTTLFRCITGLSHPRQGRICLHGRELRNEKDFHTLRCKVGLVLQHAEDQLFFPTVLEDVAFGPLNLGLSPDEARCRAIETLASLGLAGFEDRLTHRLSGGEKKLISLATVLAMQPEALLLDEPTNDLDNTARQRLLEILEGLDTARIIISHDWEFLARMSTSYLTIVDGRLSDAAPMRCHEHRHAHPLGDIPHEH